MKEQRRNYPYKPHAFKAISMEQLMGLTRPPRMEVLHKWESEQGDIEVMSRGMTVVLSRDVRANVKIAADIAVAIAKKNPDRPVWYVNTFAGIDLMQDAMERARINSGLSPIVVNPVIDGVPEHPPLTPPAAAGGESGLLPNLHIFEIPFGEWDAMELVKAMQGDDWVDPETEQYMNAWAKKQREERLAKKGPLRPIVVLNSFDYSPLSRGGKWKMARELMNLLEQFDMSLVLFTQEMRIEFEAGIAGRGSVGLMCGIAARVARMRDPFERLIRSRSPRIQAEKAIVHEAQMHASDTKKKEERMSIVVKHENGVVFDEATGSKGFLARHLGELLLD